MKSMHTQQLGPWSHHEQINLASRQFYRISANKQENSPRKIILPKLAKILSSSKHIQVKPKQIKQKNQEQLKMNAVQIQLQNQLRINTNATELSQARKSRTLSFNPPMISFYNDKHPKIKKIKQRNNLKLKSFFNERELDSKQTQIQSSVSKINLLQQNLSSRKQLKLALEQQKHQALKNRSSFRRLINLLNQSDNNQSWTQRTKSYLYKQKLNGINRYLKSNNNTSMQSINQQTFYPYRETEKKLNFKRQNSFHSDFTISK